MEAIKDDADKITVYYGDNPDGRSNRMDDDEG